MFQKLWLVPLLLAVSIPFILTAAPSSAPSAPTTTQKSQIPSHTKSDRSGHHGGGPIVYTADKSRDRPSGPNPNPPYPSSNRPNTIPTNIRELYDEIQPEGTDNKDQSENKGFVDPIDFNSFLSDVGYKQGSQPENIPIFAGSDTKDTFASFFNSKNNGDGHDKDIFVEPNFGGLSSASSNTKQRKHGGDAEDDSGFVDPNVQFRSLFDSSETANGFSPQDFLGSKDDPSGVEPSKGSQTRAYPSFTYTGRNGRGKERGDDGKSSEADYEPQANNNNNKYRSSYRQVDSRGDQDRDGDRQQSGSGSGSGSGGRSSGSSFDPYDDSSYYGGEYDSSPRAPENPRHRQQQQQQQGNGQFHRRQGPVQGQGDAEDSRENYSPAVQESAHKPQASQPKAAESGNGKAKCKKVNKLVDEADDGYAGYVDPEPDYDPSTYSGQDDERYKRQASGGSAGRNRQQGKSGGNKRPMTCYVCEDEQGRYAERCSFDSKDPKGNNNNYFTSSSTSYNDNGRRPQGGRSGSSSDRYRRNPSLSASNSKLVTSTAASAASTSTLSPLITTTTTILPQGTTEPSHRDKRQETRGGGGGGGGRNSNYDDDDYADANSRETDGDFGGRVGGSRSSANGRGRAQDEDREEPEEPSQEEDDGGEDYSPQGSSRSNDDGNPPPRVGLFGTSNNAQHDYVPPSTNTQRGAGSGSVPRVGGGSSRGSSGAGGGANFGFGPPQRRGGSSGGSGGQEFDFGPPRDFGRDAGPAASGSSNRDQGYDAGFDFAIPREFDPDVQIRTANTNSRPVFSNSQSNDFGLGNFDNGYDDYIKKYFPGFGEGGEDGGGGGGSASSSSGSTPGPSPASTSYRPSSSYSSSPSPSTRGHGGHGDHGGHGGHGGNGGGQYNTPNKEHTQQSHNYAPAPHHGGGGNRNNYHHDQNDHPEHLDKLIGSFSQKDRSGCEKIYKGDMTCYVCRDARGMNKEECMYAAGDPNGKNTRMSYHESTEYSSPPVSILPLPLQRPASGGSSASTASPSEPTLIASHSSHDEKIISPLDYDFDY